MWLFVSIKFLKLFGFLRLLKRFANTDSGPLLKWHPIIFLGLLPNFPSDCTLVFFRPAFQIKSGVLPEYSGMSRVKISIFSYIVQLSRLIVIHHFWEIFLSNPFHWCFYPLFSYGFRPCCFFVTSKSLYWPRI